MTISSPYLRGVFIPDARVVSVRINAVTLLGAAMEYLSNRLGAAFFGKDKINRRHYTAWIIVTLGLILGIWVVAGLGLLASVTAISSVLVSTSFVGMAGPLLYSALFAALTIPFVGIVFLVHRARRAAGRETVHGFAGFAWDGQD